jgi:hypothetical protein
MMISLFPPEDQKRFRFPVENGNNAPPGVVELELLEKAACRVWQWILREFAGIAQKEGRRNFLNIHEKRVCSFFADDPPKLNHALSRSSKKPNHCGKV